MNIEIANRLVQLRKKYGYSQEELAARLGISRQAVSKWERAESSPDTDNLICLAKLYNVSLDELLKSDESIEDISYSKQEERSKSSVNISKNGIYVKDGDDEVNINLNGIHVKDIDGEVHIGSKFSEFDSTIQTEEYKRLKNKIEYWHSRVGTGLTLLTSIAYILIGFLFDAWHPGWILFVAIPLYFSLIDAIIYKNPHKFAFPVLTTLIFLVLGFCFNLWHPGWVVYLFVPIYYLVFPSGKKRIIYRNIDGKVYKDFGNKEDINVVYCDDEEEFDDKD